VTERAARPGDRDRVSVHRLALRLTLPVKPPVRAMLIVYVVLAPAEMDREVGDAESEKSAAGAGAVTISVTDVA
jgi:hypothetical protein